jgi:hypothetical protein
VATSGFRDFTAAEGRGTSRIVTTIQANEFPVGEYEFYHANGSVVTLVGTGKIIAPNTESATSAPSCSWGGFVTGAGTPGRVCNASTAGQVDVNQAVCSCR